MKILIACEESQTVTRVMREKGHEAFSCDLQLPSGGHPEWHIFGDVTHLLNGNCKFHTLTMHKVFRVEKWDMIIAFPPCTYMTNASAVRMRVNGEIQKERYEKMLLAKKFFLTILNSDCNKIAIENPVPMSICELPPYSQIIQPYEFGHNYSKRTCLWLKNLPLLKPTKIVTNHEPYVNGGNKNADGTYRRFKGRNERDPKTRSKTFEGVAKAMAEQWTL